LEQNLEQYSHIIIIILLIVTARGGNRVKL